MRVSMSSSLSRVTLCGQQGHGVVGGGGNAHTPYTQQPGRKYVGFQATEDNKHNSTVVDGGHLAPVLKHHRQRSPRN